jgi:hypothetical protein
MKNIRMAQGARQGGLLVAIFGTSEWNQMCLDANFQAQYIMLQLVHTGMLPHY